MFYKITLLLFLTYSMHAMQSDNGQLPPFENEKEEQLNKASQDVWDMLARFTNGEKVTKQEALQTNKEFEQSYQEFLKRHRQS